MGYFFTVTQYKSIGIKFIIYTDDCVQMILDSMMIHHDARLVGHKNAGLSCPVQIKLCRL